MTMPTTGNRLDIKLTPKMRLIAVGIGGLMVLLMVLDFTVLRGETVFRKWNMNFRKNPRAMTVTLDRVGEKHTLVLDSRKRELALSWKIVDPRGRELASETEYIRHDGVRSFSFVPGESGEYRLEVGRERGELFKSGYRDRVNVRVLVGDRQILAPVFSLFKF